MIISFIPNTIFADSNLNIENWIVDSKLLDNGDLTIVEDITFRFDDEFNGVFRDIVLEGTDGINDFSLYEIISEEENEYSLSSNASKGDSNVYMMIDEDNSKTIQIFSPSKNENKTFRLKYRLENVAIRHKDTGELYYKFLGEDNETPIDYFSANIKLPKFNQENIDIFGHGPSNGKIYFTENNLIQLEVNDVSDGNFIEGRILFPLDYISNSTNIGKNNLDNILKKEKAYAEKIKEDAAQKEKTKDIFNNLSLVFSAITLVSIAFIFNRFRRNPNIFHEMDSLYPNLISPAEVSIFMNQGVNIRTLLASLFDLTNRKYITMDELKIDDEDNIQKKRRVFRSKDEEKEFIFTKTSNPTSKLIEHEKHLIDWIFSLGDGKQVSTLDIENYRKKHYKDFYKSLNKWIKKIRENLKSRKYYDHKGKKYAIYLCILYAIILVVSIFSIINSAFYGIILIVLSSASLVYAVYLFNRKSDKGHIEYLLWKDFKDDISVLSEKDMDITQDKSLIYAIALGVPMKDLNDYRQTTSPDYYPMYWGYWYFLFNKKGGSLMEDRVSNSFYGSYGSSTSSSTGTSFGSGGGFSGGGGGGAGGGGAGGF